MKTIKQDIFHSFKCIADKCPKTCCSGWQIVVDDDSLDNYTELKEPLRTHICEGVDWDEGCFLQRANRDCHFLAENGLCNMIIEGGEELLCDTCRLYPRHVEEYEDLREWSVSLSCPVAANMLLSRKDYMTYSVEEDDEPDPLEEEFEDFDFLFMEKLLESRDVMKEIIHREDISFLEKCGLIRELAKRLQENFDTGEYFLMDEAIEEFSRADFINEASAKYAINFDEYIRKNRGVLDKLEVLDESWKNKKKLLKFLVPGSKLAIEGTNEKEHEMQLSNMLESFIYTYYPGAVYNGMVYAYTEICIFACLITEAIAKCQAGAKGGKLTLEAYGEILYSFCRETEHSDDNISELLEYFDL